MRRPSIRLLTFVAVLSTACATATPPPDSPKVEGPRFPPAGSTWTISERLTGSFGSGTQERTLRALGEQAWDGKKVIAYTDGVDTFYWDDRARFLAIVRQGQPRMTFEPYHKASDWPLFVGKWWLNRFTQRDHERGRTFTNVEWDAKVAAYEDVKTPAGTFKAFKIVFGNPFASDTMWWSPDLAITVKSRNERYSNYYLGHGTAERELVKHDIKRQP